MIEQSGKVVALEREYAWVQTLQQSACASCAANKGCGVAVLERMSSGRIRQSLVRNSLETRVGDRVIIGIPEDAMLKASILVYLLPLIMMIVFAVGASMFSDQNELITIVAGFVGLFSGFGLVKILALKGTSARAFEPVMLRLDHDCESQNFSDAGDICVVRQERY